MNISAAHLPIQHIIATNHTGGVNSPKLAAAASIDVETSPHPSSDISNPTYEKPTQANTPSSDSKNQEASSTVVNEQIEESSGSELKGSIVDFTDGEQGETKQTSNEIYSEVELAQISELKTRDAEVIAHERAHASVGGQHAGSPNYSYKTGPDGVKYAVSGEVSIDTSSVAGDPQATLQKAQQIKAAALAPAEPSGQDRKVAAKADQMATQARNDILEANRDVGPNDASSTAQYTDTSVPDHFTKQQSLSADGYDISDNLQELMNERNFHINEFYQNITTVDPLSELEITV